MSKEQPIEMGELNPQYHTYKPQKCFVGLANKAKWHDDIISSCEEILPKFGLEAWYVDNDPTKPVRDIVVGMINSTRYGIYDLSFWKNEKNEWVMPSNEFIELGMAIALNRPTLLIQHAESHKFGPKLPDCLESIRDRIFDFTGGTTLKAVLETRLPQWIPLPTQLDWRSHYCIFGNRICEYRTAHPFIRQREQEKMYCHIGDGPDIDRLDFRGVVEEILERYKNVTYSYLDGLSLTDGYDFLLCTYCQTLRSTPFAIYRITPQTPGETFIAIGISIALEALYNYKIPKILLTEDNQDVPSLLSGYKVIEAQSDREKKKLLQEFLPNVMKIVHETGWKAKPLPFIEQDKQNRVPQEVEQPGNPYNPGPVLKPRDNLFVGRHDLVQQLEEALSRDDRRPTFLLTGARRMGKSSLLKQLPNLLGAQYIPIVFDLQIPSVSSSAAAFLGAIAEEIYRALTIRGIGAKKLEYEKLQKATRKNEAEVYRTFDDWLENVEHTLDQEERTLFLVFDEFENLEEAGGARYLDLRLLLDWFRSIIQFNRRVALLFSGLLTLSEMSNITNIDWASYFVNMQTLRISFLQTVEARRLITQPVPGFPGEEIYGEEVVEEIIRMTGCHPFLVQAVCSALIDNLIAVKRTRAEIRDVTIAVNRVLENWWDSYFRDLWERTDQEQRKCLIAVKSLKEGDLLQITQQCGLDERTIRHSLDKLLLRDIVVTENGNYRISTLIFSEWVERM